MMKKYLGACLGLLLITSFTANAQNNWSPWVTVYQDNATPTPHVVQISFKMNAHCLGYSFYRTNTNFSIQYGTVSFSFDYLDCDGQPKGETVTVELDSPKMEAPIGYWFIGSQVITEYRDVKFYQPKTISRTNTSGIGGGGGPGSNDISPEQNRDKAIAQKTELDNTRRAFNDVLLSSSTKIYAIADARSRQKYAQQLDSIKAQYNNTDQQTIQYYQAGNGILMGKNLITLRNIVSRARQWYVSMEGDLVIREKQDVNKNSSTSNHLRQNINNSPDNDRPSTAVNNNTDAIQQSLQKSQAQLNLKYDETHHASANQIQQDQQQVNTLNSQDLTSGITSLSNAVMGAIERNNREKQDDNNMLYNYKSLSDDADRRVQEFTQGNSNNKEILIKAGDIYMQVATWGEGPAPALLASKPLQNMQAIQLNNIEKAGNTFKKVLEIDPNSFEAIKGFAVCMILCAEWKFQNAHYLTSRRTDREAAVEQAELAKKYLLKLISIDPNNITAFRGLSAAYFMTGDKKNYGKYEKYLRFSHWYGCFIEPNI
ncbi:MAG TPA: hypothetical protein VHB54_09435 [Mucilaginibacter sp.]|nr:hypothetical protein [Mucilaginibacter sp.]HVW99589.1 hypothetical protein [Candidatus Babeliaceae bacterium]